MRSVQSHPSGIWLPLITPFRDGVLDVPSVYRLVTHFAAKPVDGLILAATTGEGMTLDPGETERLVKETVTALATAGRRLPLFLGLSGSDTRHGVSDLARTASWPIDGYLIACPYYSRPSQAGLYQHFHALSEGTDRPILIYNIPYRTGVNLGNETMLRLAERPNIVGVKDCCANAEQSFDLLRARPSGFAVMTGEDALFHTALTQGADGGILAAAHVETEAYATVRALLRAGEHDAALTAWRALIDLPRLLFLEPNPAPIKHWLWRADLIDSPELRLPMTGISAALAARINGEFASRQAARVPSPRTSQLR